MNQEIITECAIDSTSTTNIPKHSLFYLKQPIFKAYFL